MDITDTRDAVDQRLLLHHLFLVFKVDEDGGDPSLLKLRNVRQLPPHSTASPANGLDESIGSLHLLFR
jgi:hypothetical protein